MKKYLSASLMCADLTKLEEQIFLLEKAGIDYLHLDIMDGAFVPNITLGFDMVNAIKRISKIPLDVHMMVNEPSRFIDYMNLDKNDILCVHYEADVHIQRTLDKIQQKGCKAGLALNPHTSLSAIDYLMDYVDMLLIMTVSPGFAGQKLVRSADKKVKLAKQKLSEMGYADIPIEVDGNITPENGRMLSNCGADIFVLGTSSLFIKNKSLEKATNEFKNILLQTEE